MPYTIPYIYIYIYIFIWYGIYVSGGHSKSTVSQDCQILTPSPLVQPCSFSCTPPSNPSPPPSPVISLVELNVSFKKTQWNFYKVDTTGA